MKYFFLSCLLFSGLALSKPFTAPYLSGPVVDEMHLLNANEIEGLDQRVRSIREKTNVQMAILITPTLQGLEIEPYSLKVAEAWKLGTKEHDRGLLFVIAPNERRMRLEVGYGIEGEIPDVVAKRILSDGVAPYFKTQAYAQGILTGLEWIEARLEKKPFEEPRPNLSRNELPPFFVFLILIVVFLSVFARAFFHRGGSRFSNRYDHWGGGRGWGGGGGSWGGGGGGWSGGGGGFGGGGSSSSW